MKISLLLFLCLLVSLNSGETRPEPEKLSIYEKVQDFDLQTVLGLFLNLSANILTNYIGVSGSGLVYALFIFLFHYTTKEAIPIYKMCNLVASCMNVIYVFKKRRVDNPDELILNWDLAGFCLPILFSGSMIGIIVSNFFPGFYLQVFILAILIFVSAVTFFQTFKKQVKADPQEMAPLVKK